MIINGHLLHARAPIKNMVNQKIREHGVTYGLGEAGYDIRIKQEVLFCADAHNSLHIVDGGPARNGRFVLASAMEEFQMPEDLVGVVHDKSTWARQGLSVFNTIIEPGWNGFLTLELVYHGSRELIIPAGAGIAQVLFHQTAESRPYVGRYQNQANEPVLAIEAR